MDELYNSILLGSEYQDLELSLEITKDRLIGYDSYIYVQKELHNNLKHFKYEIELLYHWEILQAVIIKTETYSELLDNLAEKYNYRIHKLTIGTTIYYVYSVTDNLTYKIDLSLLC